jgi:hypothetical protein
VNTYRLPRAAATNRAATFCAPPDRPSPSAVARWRPPSCPPWPPPCARELAEPRRPRPRAPTHELAGLPRLSPRMPDPARRRGRLPRRRRQRWGRRLKKCCLEKCWTKKYCNILQNVDETNISYKYWTFQKNVGRRKRLITKIFVLFVWLISHQPAVLFSQNKLATSNQPTVLFSQNKSAPAISHQPNEQAD